MVGIPMNSCQWNFITESVYAASGIVAEFLEFAIARKFVKFQSGYVYHYAFLMLVGVAVIVTWILILGR